MLSQRFLIGFVLVLFLSGCNKEDDLNTVPPTENDLLVNTWKFSEKPDELISYYLGTYRQDYTVFSGDEILSFSSGGIFYINSIEYGKWSRDKYSITIDMRENNMSYGVGSPQSYMMWSIYELSSTKLEVNHPFYKFYPNIYKLEAQ